MRIAVDTGGTFTDCVYLRDGKVHVLKVFSTPANPADAIIGALRKIVKAGGQTSRKQIPRSARNDKREVLEVRHGTTVGTNTLLERKGARVAFVTTAGFEDTIAIGRQARPRLYDWFVVPDPPLAPPELRFGAQERTSATGEILKAPSAEDLQTLCAAVAAARPEAVAISLLFSFANPKNEQTLAAALQKLGLPISLSHEILPEFREYERASTVVVNAYLAPKMGRYISGLQRALDDEFAGGRLQVMQSSGGIVSAQLAAKEPVRTVLSGPAGGVVGAYAVARMAGFEKIISFDMGGTSTDVALVDGGDHPSARRGPRTEGLRTTNESFISGLPISVPTLDIHTVGAGGGSLARFDAGGALRVGPQSAGADPGPVCYGRGTEPTVTDANLVLGRLDPEFFLGGEMSLDEARARQYLEQAKGPLASVEEFAAGIVRLSEAAMENAIRVISVERGHDPREFTLVSFGGAGPLHACALARALRIPRVLVPQMPGALSALGILMSDAVKDYSRTVMLAPEAARLERYFRELQQRGEKEMRAEGLKALAMRYADVRYAGQGFELSVPFGRDFVKRFHQAHRRRYGYADEQRRVEVVNVRVRMVASSEPVPFPRKKVAPGNGEQAVVKQGRVVFDGRTSKAPVYERASLRPGDTFAGPAIVAEYSATTVLPPRCRARVDERENIVIEVR
ncbi:MAG: hydantoinase/oxoprolinase family protein [Acidobacteriia bacterium]|nr:hydantoinase/oxoprolinase family protein [Terriglobia bacterium]